MLSPFAIYTFSIAHSMGVLSRFLDFISHSQCAACEVLYHLSGLDNLFPEAGKGAVSKELAFQRGQISDIQTDFG